VAALVIRPSFVLDASKRHVHHGSSNVNILGLSLSELLNRLHIVLDRLPETKLSLKDAPIGRLNVSACHIVIGAAQNDFGLAQAAQGLLRVPVLE
jgi:hypothetical protein